jgi:phycocyanobilin lyase beta subunit
MTEPSLAQKLIRAVEEADSSTRLLEAVQQLAAAALVETVPMLITALGYNNPGAAVAAVDGLILIGEPAVESLLALLDNHNYGARAWAIRALAGIGDPRGLSILLEAAQTDFALSVRRAAARGLGVIRWHQLSTEQVPDAQTQVFASLLTVSQDPEWVVRYAAIVGLQSLAIAALVTHPQLVPKILNHFDNRVGTDLDLSVQTRIRMAQQQLSKVCESVNFAIDDALPENSETDWQTTLRKVYRRKSEERPIPEGDPRRYRHVATTVQSIGSSEQPIDDIDLDVDTEAKPTSFTVSQDASESGKKNSNFSTLPLDDPGTTQKSVRDLPKPQHLIPSAAQARLNNLQSFNCDPNQSPVINSEWINHPIIQHNSETDRIELIPSRAAWWITQQLSLEAAYIFLRFATHTFQSLKPWDEPIQFKGIDLIKDLSWSNQAKAISTKKLQNVQNLVELICRVSVLIRHTAPHSQRYQHITSPIWNLEAIEYSGMLVNPNVNADGDALTYTVEAPDELRIQVRLGLWTQEFLKQHQQRCKDALRQYGYLAQSILQINPTRNQLAAKLAIYLTAMSYVHPTGNYDIIHLLEQIESQAQILEIQDNRAKRHKFIEQWDNALCVLRQLGWEVEFDPETYPESIRPTWSLPYSSLPYVNPRPNQWLSSWLNARIVIRPTNLIQQQLGIHVFLEDSEAERTDSLDALDTHYPEEIPSVALEKALSAKGLSQSKLAEQLNLDRSMVTRWIKGTRPIHPRHRELIWQLLGDELQLLIKN